MKIKTPPMGFNTWNTFGEVYSEQVICEVADAMVDRGFLEAGYDHLIIDDWWEMDYRDSETNRMIPRPKKFPNSDIRPTIDYVHSKGMKFGLWFEPEMVSPDSDLFRAHPDWAMGVAGRSHSLGRNQLVLDLAREDVFDITTNPFLCVEHKNKLKYGLTLMALVLI